MKKIFLVLFLLPFLLFGQESSESTEAEEDEYEYVDYIAFEKYSLGITPSAFMNLYGGIQLSQDFGLTERWNISVETGYLFFENYNNAITGYRIKPGLQYMVWSEGIAGFAIGANVNYRNTITEREFVRVYWEEGFRETKKIERTKILIGGEVMFSLFIRLNDVLRMELGAGLGAGDIQTSDSETLEPEFRLINRGLQDIFDLSDDGLVPMGSFHINFSYDISLW